MLHEIYLPYPNIALLLLRLIVGIIFIAGGWLHARDPEGRSKSIGMSKSFTLFLGVAEIAGGLGVAFGVLVSWASIGLILIMLGAIYKKAVVWKSGFWGKGSQGWHYDLMIALVLFVLLTVGPGTFVFLH